MRTKTKTTNKTQCRPNGPYCTGLNAILDAKVKHGVQRGILFGGETRTVVTHSAIVGGEKTRMVFSWCPCCGGALTHAAGSDEAP